LACTWLAFKEDKQLADNESGSSEQGTQAAEFHVNLGESGDATAMAESESDEATETTEAVEAEPDKAKPDKTEEKEETFLTDDDKDVDLNDPAYKAAYKRLLASYTRKVQRIQKEVPTATKAPEQPATQEAAQPASPQGEWDPYTVPLDAFKYVGEPEPDGSDLSGFEQSIDRRIEAGVKKAIEFTLNQMRVNDGVLRQQNQVGTAREAISKYAEVLMAHPEYEAHAAELAEYAQLTKDMAVKNPEKWIRSVEAITGIKRNWQEETAEDDEPMVREQSNQRLANKSRAQVQRPTNGAKATLAGKNTGRMTAEEAFEAAWRARH
jgi:hypothetical protein